MIESNNKKHLFVKVFTLLIKNYVNMKSFLVRNLKTETIWFNPRHLDSIPKTGTVSAKPRQLKCLKFNCCQKIYRYFSKTLRGKKTYGKVNRCFPGTLFSKNISLRLLAWKLKDMNRLRDIWKQKYLGVVLLYLKLSIMNFF